MKSLLICLGLQICLAASTYGQDPASPREQIQQIHSLIDSYSQARAARDSALVGKILTDDIDQLVSTGKWRKGIAEALHGMMQSSEANPGSRTLTIENIRFIDTGSAIVDARYEIQNSDNTSRKMWSTFVVIRDKGLWKISAIRNMLPAGYNN